MDYRYSNPRNSGPPQPPRGSSNQSGGFQPPRGGMPPPRGGGGPRPRGGFGGPMDMNLNTSINGYYTNTLREQMPPTFSQ